MEKYSSITALLLSFSVVSYAQNIEYTQQNEILINQVGLDPKVLREKYANIEGSPYLFDNWAKGNLVDNLGNVLKDVDIKYNQVERIFLVKKTTGDVYTFTGNIRKVEIFEVPGLKKLVFESDFEGGKGVTNRNFYQVLNSGRFLLLLESTKSIEESRNYLGVVNKSIQKVDRYAISDNKKFIKFIKLDKSSILNALKEMGVDASLKDKGLNLKKLDDVITFLNSLNEENYKKS